MAWGIFFVAKNAMQRDYLVTHDALSRESVYFRSVFAKLKKWFGDDLVHTKR